MARKAGKLNFGSWDDFLPAFRDAYGEGREEWSKAYRNSGNRKTPRSGTNSENISDSLRAIFVLDGLLFSRFWPFSTVAYYI